MSQDNDSYSSSSDSDSSVSEAAEESNNCPGIVEETPQILIPTPTLQFDFATLRILKWLLIDQDVEHEIKEPPDVENSQYIDEEKWKRAEKEILKVNFACEWQRCTAQFPDRIKYAYHIKDHYDTIIKNRRNSDEEFRCEWDMCGFKTNDGYKFELHVMGHDRHGVYVAHGEQMERRLKLPKCHMVNMERNRLPEKIEEHRCRWSNCTKSLKSLSFYKEHVFGHFPMVPKGTYNSPLPCLWDNCKMKFSIGNPEKLRTLLVDHVRRKHMAALRPKYVCRKCGHFKGSAHGFIEHFLSQLSEKDPDLCCKYCNRMFLVDAHLRQHLKRHHLGVVCEICHQKFSTPYLMKNHINTQHLKIHKFKCKLCDAHAISQNLLDRHMLKHQNSKPDQFACNLCSYKSYLEFNVKHHTKMQHPEQRYPYECHLCGKHYRAGHIIGAHFRKAHQLTVPPDFRIFTFRLENNSVYKLRLTKDFQFDHKPKYEKTIMPKELTPIELKVKNMEVSEDGVKIDLESVAIVKPEPPAPEIEQIVTRAKAKRIKEELEPKKKSRRKPPQPVNGVKKESIKTEVKEEPTG